MLQSPIGYKMRNAGVERNGLQGQGVERNRLHIPSSWRGLNSGGVAGHTGANRRLPERSSAL
jgi:hypothetical protein